MKIGILADIHANLRALKAILNIFYSYKVEKIFCLGDMIGYYHNSLEVLELLKEKNIQCILGNHEAYLLGYLKCSPEKWQICFLDQVKKKISPDYLDWLYKLPETLEITLNDQKIAFFHGSPWDHFEEYFYPDSDNFNKFVNLPFDYILLGHTHYPMFKKISNINVINPGSCGQPRDRNLKAKAAILNLKDREISFIEEPYDIRTTVKEAQLAGVPFESIRVLKGIK